MGKKLHKCQSRLKQAEDRAVKAERRATWSAAEAKRIRTELESLGPFGYRFRREFGDLMQLTVAFQPLEISYRYHRNGSENVSQYLYYLLEDMKHKIMDALLKELTKDLRRA